MLGASLLSQASPLGQQIQSLQMRQADFALRNEIQKIRAQAGAGSTVTANVNYTVGPDGVVYASGGTVTTTTRSQDVRPDQQVGQTNNVSSDVEQSLGQQARAGALQRRPATLADVAANKLSLSPMAFAEAFSEEFVDDLQRSKLQIVDRGVRSQENLHFRAAGGLASGGIQYGYEIGPDGELYATSGSVGIQTVATNDPNKAARDNATLAIAATAPGDASAQDISVARSALNKAANAYDQIGNPPEEPGSRFAIAA